MIFFCFSLKSKLLAQPHENLVSKFAALEKQPLKMNHLRTVNSVSDNENCIDEKDKLILELRKQVENLTKLNNSCTGQQKGCSERQRSEFVELPSTSSKQGI